MPYVRHTAFSFDPAKKDAMMSHLTGQLDMFKGTSGLARILVAQVTEDRMIVTAGYDNKEAADAAAEKARGVRDGMAEFVNGEPVVGEGEVVWSYDVEGTSSRPVTAGYIRHNAISFDPSKFDAMMSYADTTVDNFKGWSGLRRIRVVRVAEDRIVVTGVYDSKEAADANAERARANFAGMAEYMTGEPLVREGDLVWRYDR